MKCKHPKLIYNKYLGTNVFVPCGKCAACRINKANSLIPRVINECNNHPFNVFFTLTYDNDHLSYIDINEPSLVHVGNGEVLTLDNSVPTEYLLSPPNIYKLVGSKLVVDDSRLNHRGVLCKYDVQCFLKRVRSALKYAFENFEYPFTLRWRTELINTLVKSDNSIVNYETLNKSFDEEIKKLLSLRYFVCGEYGTSHHRNHFHGIFHVKSFEVAEWLLQNIPENWKFCDWSKVANTKCGKDGRSGLPSLVDDSAAAYVSTYVNSVDYKFPLAQYRDFKPFCLYSRRPVYGLSSLDKIVEKEIFDGTDYTFQQTLSIKSGVSVVVEPSSLLTTKIFCRLPNFNNFNVSYLVSLVLGHIEAPKRSFSIFANKIRRLVYEKFGFVNSITVSEYIQRVKSYLSRLHSFRFSKQLKQYSASNPIDYVKRQFQTFANYFTPHSFAYSARPCVLDFCRYSLVRLVSVYAGLLPLADVLKQPLSDIFSVFQIEIADYIIKYNNYLIPKHSHSSNPYYYATI